MQEFINRRQYLVLKRAATKLGLSIDLIWLSFNLVWLFIVKHGEPIDVFTCIWSGLVGMSLTAVMCDWRDLREIKKELQTTL